MNKWILLIFLAVFSIPLSSCFLPSPVFYNIKIIKESAFIPVKGVNFKLASNLIVNISGNEIIVPKGFITDLASVPRFFWSIFPPTKAIYVYPSILHDYLYQSPAFTTRRYADDVFYSFLIERGASQTRALEFYYAVRIFGAHHFNVV